MTTREDKFFEEHEKKMKTDLEYGLTIRALESVAPDYKYEKGKGKYDLKITFSKGTKRGKSEIIAKSTGKPVAVIKGGQAMINGKKEPVWKILGYKSQTDQINHIPKVQTIQRGKGGYY